MISVTASAISPGRRRLADREAFAEVVHADPDRDQEREPDRRVRQVEPAAASRTRRPPRRRADERRRAPVARLFIHAS